MMKKYRYVLVALLGILTSVSIAAQTFDFAGNSYKWNEQELRLLDAQQNTLFKWQNPGGGRISWVDPGNPFKILVFLKDENQLIILNNKLAPIGETIELDQLEIFNPIAVSYSKAGGFWVLDASQQRLFQYSGLLSPQTNVPISLNQAAWQNKKLYLAEDQQSLFLLIPGEQILVLDIYGQVLQKIPGNWTHLYRKDGLVVFQEAEESWVYVPKTRSLKSLIKKP